MECKDKKVVILDNGYCKKESKYAYILKLLVSGLRRNDVFKGISDFLLNRQVWV